MDVGVFCGLVNVVHAIRALRYSVGNIFLHCGRRKNGHRQSRGQAGARAEKTNHTTSGMIAKCSFLSER